MYRSERTWMSHSARPERWKMIPESERQLQHWDTCLNVAQKSCSALTWCVFLPSASTLLAFSVGRQGNAKARCEAEGITLYESQGRPKKGPEPAFSLQPLVSYLEKLLQTKVCCEAMVILQYSPARESDLIFMEVFIALCSLQVLWKVCPMSEVHLLFYFSWGFQVLFATDCIGEEVQKQLAQLEDGQVRCRKEVQHKLQK